MDEQVPMIVKAATGGNVYAVTDYEVLEGGMVLATEKHDVTSQIEALVARGAVGDGFHTMPQLYDFRLLYHALLVNWLHSRELELKAKSAWTPHLHAVTVKSWWHSDGRVPFGGSSKEWFIVVTTLPGSIGQVSNHYRAEHWDKFVVPDVQRPPAYDGHTTAEVLERWSEYLMDAFVESPF